MCIPQRNGEMGMERMRIGRRIEYWEGKGEEQKMGKEDRRTEEGGILGKEGMEEKEEYSI